MSTNLKELYKFIIRSHFLFHTQREIIGEKAEVKYFSTFDASGEFWQVP